MQMFMNRRPISADINIYVQSRNNSDMNHLLNKFLKVFTILYTFSCFQGSYGFSHSYVSVKVINTGRLYDIWNGPRSSFSKVFLTPVDNYSSILLSIEASKDAIAQKSVLETSNDNFINVLVFIVGIIPFAIATNEFWRRIAVGEPFGTGSDSVIITIGQDNNPQSSRGRQRLGKGALTIAYILFAVAAFAIGIAVYSVISSPPFQGGQLQT